MLRPATGDRVNDTKGFKKRIDDIHHQQKKRGGRNQRQDHREKPPPEPRAINRRRLDHRFRHGLQRGEKEQKVIAGTASAQFESLKNQIDPHFLFNSLNVLSALIEENPESAQKFTTSLSKIYRYVLEQKDKELVTVSEELNFAKTYMNLLKMRFENSITFDLPTDFSNDLAKVVPLSLQLLLENCIKHNVVSESKPLHIKIYMENNFLVVENNLQKKEVLTDRKGVGLQKSNSDIKVEDERKNNSD